MRTLVEYITEGLFGGSKHKAPDAGRGIKDIKKGSNVYFYDGQMLRGGYDGPTTDWVIGMMTKDKIWLDSTDGTYKNNTIDLNDGDNMWNFDNIAYVGINADSGEKRVIAWNFDDAMRALQHVDIADSNSHYKEVHAFT